MSGRPLDVLEDALDGPVTVQLKDGRLFRGLLAGYDQHMNLVIDPADAEPEATVSEDVHRVADTTIIRGDNVVTVRT
jgi:small nuclear ribonucleoprotein